MDDYSKYLQVWKEMLYYCKTLDARAFYSYKDTFYVQEDCGCYSEYTQEPPVIKATFTFPNIVIDLGKRNEITENLIQIAKKHIEFRGCDCCDEDDQGAYISDWFTFYDKTCEEKL